MWWKFKRHRVAVVSGIVLLLMYGSTLVTEILVPYNLHTRHTDFIYASPQSVHWVHEGRFAGPFVYPLVKKLNMETLRRDYTEDTARPYPLRFFCSGDTYEFWGLFDASFHLVCPPEGATLFLLGTDRLGRDVMSRDLLRSPDLAHDRPARHRHQLRAGPALRRHRRLFRRLGGHGHPAGDRDHPLVSRAAVVDGAVGGAAGDVEPDPHLLRHHRDSGVARLDRARPRRALQAARAARGGLLHRRAADGGEPEADHRTPPAAGLHEPSHRRGVAVDPEHDPGRDGALVPRHRAAPPDHELGRAAERGAEHQRRRALSRG